MTRHPAFVALVRLTNLVFFLATTAYCLLAYIPFTYQAFLRPQDLWIPDFVTAHVALFWLVFLMTVLTLQPYLGRQVRAVDQTVLGRWMARTYVVVAVCLGVAMVVRPVMPSIGNNMRSLVIGLLALVPPVWMAVFDHVAAAPVAVEVSEDRHALRTCLFAALCVWAVYAIGVPFRLKHVAGMDLPFMGLLASAGLSAVMHLFAFMMVFLMLAVTSRIAQLARAGGSLEYRLLVAVAAAAIALVIYELIFTSLTFVGFPAAASAVAVGFTMALAWSGIAQWQGRAAGTGPWTARQLFLSPVGYRDSRLASAVALALLPLAAYGLVSAAAGLDWNFIIQKLSVLLVWVIAFASVHTLVRRDGSKRGSAMIALGPIIVLAAFQGADVVTARARLIQEGPLNPDFLFDRYSAVDLSFRLIRDQRVLHTRETADFYALLKANTLVAPPRVVTGAIQFAHPIRTASKPPHIFLFVIDSLRRDYLSPYNPSVTFTPSIARFASDSFVFRRAFTRYSGTALAVPSIWAGGMLIHMIVQEPFDGRDALLKLLDGGGYRRVMGIDAVMRDLLPARPDMVELDRGVSSMQTDFCRTIRELEHKLAESADDPRPVFSYTLPQNVHIGVASSHKVPPGVSYPGFFGPVADTVRQVDRCFGEFIEFLHRSTFYDDSIVILTADHGDSLGEEGRWGHGYFMVPEVMRIPLLVHLPASLRDRVTTDLNRLTFSSDITPTLYALTGNTPAELGPLFGSPLFLAPGTDLSDRRHESFLLASSYGAVYGMLRHNGRKLYAADAMDGHDDAYDVSDDRLGRRIAITQAMLALNRRLIAEQLGELATLNHFTPQP